MTISNSNRRQNVDQEDETRWDQISSLLIRVLLIIYINIFFFIKIFFFIFFFWHGGVDANNTGLPPSAATLGAVLFLKKKNRYHFDSIRFDGTTFFCRIFFFFYDDRIPASAISSLDCCYCCCCCSFFSKLKNDLKKKIKSNRNRFDKEMNQKIDHFFTVVAAAVAVVLFLRN